MIRNANYLFLPYFIYTDGGKSALRFGILEGDTHISRDSGIPYFLIFFDISGPFLPRMPCAFISYFFNRPWICLLRIEETILNNQTIWKRIPISLGMPVLSSSFIFILNMSPKKERKNYINGIERNFSLQKSKRMYGKEERAINKHIIRGLSDG